MTATFTSSSVHVDDLGGLCTPECTIIGKPGPGGVYTNANNSIAGNDPHNPFINQTAEFLLTVAGITASTVISGFTFSFGTASGVIGVGVPTAVPLPSAALLFGTALAGLGLLGRRRKKELMQV